MNRTQPALHGSSKQQVVHITVLRVNVSNQSCCAADSYICATDKVVTGRSLAIIHAPCTWESTSFVG